MASRIRYILAVLWIAVASGWAVAQPGHRGAQDPFHRVPGYDLFSPEVQAAEPEWESQTLPSPIASRQQVFAIPFTVGEPRRGEPAAAEVQLFVREGSEGDWRLESRVPPKEGRFIFRAPRDGEFWFQVRTIDTRGQLIGPVGDQPGLRVLVDTVRPEFDLNAEVLADGKVQLDWQASDPHLDPRTFRLEYQLAANGPWLPVPGFNADRDARQTGPDSLGGRFAWSPGVEQGAISVRAEIADEAGNRNATVRRIDVGEELVVIRRHDRQHGEPRRPERGDSPHPADGTPERSPDSGGWPGSVGWPADHLAARPPAHRGGQTAESGAEDYHGPYRDDRPRSDQPFWPASDGLPRSDAPYPQVSRQVRPEEAGIGDERDQPTATGPAAGSDPNLPRYVRSKSFLLDYGIESLAGIRKRIVLWSTQDGGRTWKRYGEDPNGQSPFEVTVAEAGLHGFLIVAESLETRPDREYVPRSGEAAQTWIMVDPHPPRGRLTSVQLDSSGEVALLKIRWEAFDENLIDRPVSLFLSDRPDGQWFRIAGDLPNSGQYTWRLDEGLPPEIYLRLVVRDAAGNVAEHVAEKPIRLDELRPNVQIHGVRSSQAGPRQYYLLQ